MTVRHFRSRYSSGDYHLLGLIRHEVPYRELPFRPCLYFKIRALVSEAERISDIEGDILESVIGIGDDIRSKRHFLIVIHFLKGVDGENYRRKAQSHIEALILRELAVGIGDAVFISDLYGLRGILFSEKAGRHGLLEDLALMQGSHVYFLAY